MTAGESEITDLLLRSRILVVDDISANREILFGMLQSAGFNNLLEAETGEEAVELIINANPDVVLLDLMLPGISGFDVCKTIREKPEFADLPIIAQTALADVEARSNVFAAGATDLIVKPLNMAEVLGRVRVHLTNRLLMADLRRYRERVSAELELARTMQEGLIPTAETLDEIGQRSGIAIVGHFEPSSEMGGDLWGVVPLDGRRVALYIADFSGHGVGAAINTFRLHTMLIDRLSSGLSPDVLLCDIGTALHELLPVGQFATMTVTVIDPDAEQITYAAAGSTHPILIMPDDGGVIVGSGRGYLLGAINGPSYEAQSLPFPHGASLLLYSDVLLDMPDNQGRMLEEAEVEEIAGGLAGQPANCVVDSILGRFRQDRSAVLMDDLTLIAVQHR